MLIRYDPIREIERAFRTVGTVTGRAMPAEVRQSPDGIKASFDLPGVDPETIDVTIEKGVLTVKAHREWTRSDAETVVLNERGYGSYLRKVYLGDEIDSEGIKARYEHGVLTVTAPLKEAIQPRRIQIERPTTAKAVVAGDTAEAAEANPTEGASGSAPDAAAAEG